MKKPVFCIFLSFFLACSQGAELDRLAAAHLTSAQELYASKSTPASHYPRLVALQAKLGISSVPVLVASPPGFAELAASFPGFIVLSESLMGEPDEVLAFALAHEHGHAVARHGEGLLRAAIEVARSRGVSDMSGLLEVIAELRTQQLQHQMEREADRYAKELLISKGLWSPSAVRRALQELASPLETAAHPSAQARYREMGLP